MPLKHSSPTKIQDILKLKIFPTISINLNIMLPQSLLLNCEKKSYEVTDNRKDNVNSSTPQTNKNHIWKKTDWMREFAEWSTVPFATSAKQL